ncbi:hypothetical protein JTB14_031071 [Gonioctena quinquepunctata]|nr:hypothetical protein JTB14_031071 [Gonioctena quinquepunctata]
MGNSENFETGTKQHPEIVFLMSGLHQSNCKYQRSCCCHTVPSTVRVGRDAVPPPFLSPAGQLPIAASRVKWPKKKVQCTHTISCSALSSLQTRCSASARQSQIRSSSYESPPVSVVIYWWKRTFQLEWKYCYCLFLLLDNDWRNLDTQE